MNKTSAGIRFLDQASEIGRLIQTHDWSASPLGAPETWPQSLRSVVSLILGSKFPMFVVWGNQLAGLYNDAYARILGKRHPQSLGRPFIETWPEIWSDIFPIIERALAGESSYYENLPLTMERNGYPEQTFFTFSYSAVLDEAGQAVGMFCACTETTAQVYAEQRQAFQLALTDRLRHLSHALAITSSAAQLLREQLQVSRVAFADVDLKSRSISFHSCVTDGVANRLSGQFKPDAFLSGVFNDLRTGRTCVFNDLLSNPRLETLFGTARSALAVPVIRDKALQTVLVITHDRQRRWSPYEIALAEEVAERTWESTVRARAEEERHAAQEALLQQRLAETNRLRSLFASAPGFIAVLKGPDHVFEFANTSYRHLIGDRQIEGLSVREAIPEAESQGYLALLDDVYASAKPFFAYEAPFILKEDPSGPARQVYMDFVYQPIVEPDGTVSGIFVNGYDITIRKTAQDNLQPAASF